jgi:cobalt-zinc-cadmium efflux system protein
MNLFELRGEKANGAKLRALAVAVGLNAAFALGELTAGFFSRSLALISDAAHNASDVVALGVALLAHLLTSRPPTKRLTYGFERAEVLAAQLNSLMLVAAAVLITTTALRRLFEPRQIPGVVVATTAGIGVAINTVSALVVARGRWSDLNIRAATLSLMADVALSVATMLSGFAIAVWRLYWLDPALSIVISAVMCLAAGKILWEVSHVLLEAAPRNIDVGQVEEFIRNQPGVDAVHHIHIWNLSTQNPALSGHVVLSHEMTLHQAQNERDRLSRLLEEEFGIGHATLELECHPCEDEPVASI